MKSESGDVDQDWTHGDLEYDPWPDKMPFKYPVPDSVKSWHGVVEDYSHLHLTFSKDRLPALAAIVQRMLRMRKNDTYIAGLWQSSFLSDLTWWHVGGKHPRSAARVPSWSWASTTGTVRYESLAWSRFTDHVRSQKTSILSSHLDGGEILLECRSCAGRIWWSDHHPTEFIPSGEDLVMLPPDYTWEIKADYDFRTDSETVQIGDVVFIAVIKWGPLNWYGWGGLVLRQVSEATYERIGWCSVEVLCTTFPVWRKAKLRDNFDWRYFRQFVTSLPVRSFRIV